MARAPSTGIDGSGAVSRPAKLHNHRYNPSTASHSPLPPPFRTRSPSPHSHHCYTRTLQFPNTQWWLFTAPIRTTITCPVSPRRPALSHPYHPSPLLYSYQRHECVIGSVTGPSVPLCSHIYTPSHLPPPLRLPYPNKLSPITVANAISRPRIEAIPRILISVTTTPLIHACYFPLISHLSDM